MCRGCEVKLLVEMVECSACWRVFTNVLYWEWREMSCCWSKISSVMRKVLWRWGILLVAQLAEMTCGQCSISLRLAFISLFEVGNICWILIRALNGLIWLKLRSYGKNKNRSLQIPLRAFILMVLVWVS